MFNPFNLLKYPWNYIRTILNPYIFFLWILGNFAWVWGLSERISSLHSHYGNITPISKAISIVFIAISVFIVWLLLGLQFIPQNKESKD